MSPLMLKVNIFHFEFSQTFNSHPSPISSSKYVSMIYNATFKTHFKIKTPWHWIMNREGKRKCSSVFNSYKLKTSQVGKIKYYYV